MTFLFATHLLLRLPVKSPGDHTTSPKEFLENTFFRAAIYLASPVFYTSLEKQGFQFDRLTPKEALTLKKYINRYCYRPTPFGLFSSISLIAWPGSSAKPQVPDRFIPFISASMPLVGQLKMQLTGQIDPDQLFLEANPSLYRVMNEYRFIRTGLTEDGKRREHQLQSIAFSVVLKDLIVFCREPVRRPQVADQIRLLAGCSLAEAADYCDFLIDAQLLVKSQRLNITGDHYFYPISGLQEQIDYATALRNYIAPDQQPIAPVHPEQLQNMEKALGNLLPNSTDIPEKLSIILKREGAGHPLAADDQDKLRAGINALTLLSPGGSPAQLTSFVNDFRKHFEGQSLPLLQALDPEAGIGYQQPEREAPNPLLETLLIPQQRQQTAFTTDWSPVHSLMMEAWLRHSGRSEVIELTGVDLEALRTNEADLPLLGMSVLFRKTGHQLFIENAGGINAPALLGRFTVADDQIAETARGMAQHLELLNPDLLFAELLHLADPHTDNVNRRAHVYTYELPITAASTLPTNLQLSLSDLFVRVDGNQVFLFSEKHQKIVIPRLTSAYNHSLNRLPLFRFLADLAYQYGRAALGFDLRQLFPNLQYYPRVSFRDAILCLANWTLIEAQLLTLRPNAPEFLTNFTRLRREIGLPRYFSLAEGDQELVFDGDQPADIAFFAECVRQKKRSSSRNLSSRMTSHNTILSSCRISRYRSHSYKAMRYSKGKPSANLCPGRIGFT